MEYRAWLLVLSYVFEKLTSTIEFVVGKCILLSDQVI